VNSAVYADIEQQFVALLNKDERYCWYQQDGAMCHMSNETMTLLKQFFDDRIISKNLWPPCSPDLTPPPPIHFSSNITIRFPTTGVEVNDISNFLHIHLLVKEEEFIIIFIVVTVPSPKKHNNYIKNIYINSLQ
jgi:hypothetical protein